MGLFQHKQDPKKSASDGLLNEEEHFFDEYFREELRNHGRWYFEKVINENGALFKRDLEESIAQVNNELKEHITKQLDGAIAQVNQELKDHATKQLEAQFTEYSASLKVAQEQALASMTESAQTLKQQHDELRAVLQKNVTDQQDLLHNAFEENKSQITAMKEAQDAAVKWLNQSAQALNDQYQQLSTTLQKSVSQQEDMLITTFEGNMAAVIEHYLLGALGDAYDLKAQLPTIIKQMDENRQAIVEDMKL
jgi:predicted  nucleic acid-binding Zn-ribbon protein